MADDADRIKKQLDGLQAEVARIERAIASIPLAPPPEIAPLPPPGPSRLAAPSWTPQAKSGDTERDRQWALDLERVWADVGVRDYRRLGDEDLLDRVEALPEMTPEPVDAVPELPRRHLEVARPLKLDFNLIPGRRRTPPAEDTTKAKAASNAVDSALDNALGPRGADDFSSMCVEVDQHLDMLDAYLEAPSSGDDLRPRLTAASGLIAALDPYVNTIARAGIDAEGAVRAAMLRHCAKHQRRHTMLQRMTGKVAEVAKHMVHLFITGEYER
jgi:hypothetical protein